MRKLAFILTLATMLFAALPVSAQNSDTSRIILICKGNSVSVPINIDEDGVLLQQFSLQEELFNGSKIISVNNSRNFGILIATTIGIFQWDGDHLYACPEWGNEPVIDIVVSEITTDINTSLWVLVKRADYRLIRYYNNNGLLIAVHEVEGLSNSQMWYQTEGIWTYDNNKFRFFAHGVEDSEFVVTYEDIQLSSELSSQPISVDIINFMGSSETWFLLDTAEGPKLMVWNMQNWQFGYEVPLRNQNDFYFREVRDLAANNEIAAIATDIGVYSCSTISVCEYWQDITRGALTEAYLSVGVGCDNCVIPSNFVIAATDNEVNIIDVVS